MAVLPDYEYDVFISYRHNDNRSGWVTQFVSDLQNELAATIKERVSIYFDSNLYDGLLETHNVDKSLEGKLKSIIFIPIISHTYCDPKSFAWRNEFQVFCRLAKDDRLGPDVKLLNKNVASRILPVQIHDLDLKDRLLYEKESGTVLRSVEFIFKSHGVNRPLTTSDNRTDNLNRTFYRDQLNKTANAIEEILEALLPDEEPVPVPASRATVVSRPDRDVSWFWSELLRRNVFRAAFAYVVVALFLHQMLLLLTPFLELEERFTNFATAGLMIGFPVAALIAWFYEVSPHGFIRTNSEQAATNPFPSHRKKPFTSLPLVSFLVLALVFQYGYFTYIKPAIAPLTTDAEGNGIISIAVLPFENRSRDSRDKYIADGITDDIINRLTIIRQLRVTNQGKIQQYQGKALRLDAVARKLDVTILLTGSVERHDNHVAIRAQLIDETNTFIWGNTFQRTADNITAVQSEIAQVIADQLKLKLDDREKKRLHVKATENPTAYDYYLKGRSLYYKYTPAANDSAIRQFKMAIAQDPKYARAWAGLGDAFAQKYGRFLQEYAWTDSSFVAASRAVELDSTLSDAYKAMGVVYNYREEYDKALPVLLKAIELNPSNEKAVGNLGTTYLLMGDLANALKWEKKGVGMDPGNWIFYQIIGWIYRLLDDLPSAESWFRKSLDLSPDQHDTYELLAYTYVSQGRADEARKLIPRVLQIDSTDTRVLEVAGLMAHFAGDTKSAKRFFQNSIENNSDYKDDRSTVSPIGLGQILLEEGNRVDAEVYLTRAMENNMQEIGTGSKSFDLPFYVASVYAIRGNREQALTWLQKAIDLNWVDHAKVIHGPYFQMFKDDPELVQMMTKIRAKTDSMRTKAAGN
ncbi:tetratricopeptide repeat protein [Chryseolinea sp. T2]|uniref:tetratricopeptide repeat protein n=1 Tax=Chryseolinea sp. T2 TaxID=3129255 RepID=UPI0030768D7D